MYEAEILKENKLIIIYFDNKPINKIINKNVKKQEKYDKLASKAF
jgi:hypothetical protein